MEHLQKKRRTTSNKTQEKLKRKRRRSKTRIYGLKPQRRMVAEATMFEFVWYGIAKI